MNVRLSSLIYSGVCCIALAFVQTDAQANPQVAPSLPEAPQLTALDPCADMRIEDIRSGTQRHDGVRFNFNGQSARYDSSRDLWYNDHRGSTYVCEANPFVDSGNRNPQLFTDFGWMRSGAGRGDVGGRLDTGDAYLDTIGNRNSNACYVCGLIRNSSGCFPPGVRIATDAEGGDILVEEIAVGDLLWNPQTQERVRVLKVIEGPEENDLIRLGYGDVSLTVSQEHPVVTGEGIKKARDLTLADLVYDGSGDTHQLTQLEAVLANEGQTVINFILEARADLGHDGRMVLADGVVTGDLIVQQALIRADGD